MRLLSFLIAATSIQESVSTTCDILAKAGNPCVAAHSTVRALFADFDGPLYAFDGIADVSLRQKSNALTQQNPKHSKSDNTSFDVKVQSKGGFADSASQDQFCENTAACSIESTIKLRFRTIWESLQLAVRIGFRMFPHPRAPILLPFRDTEYTD